jgi:hypothetical protein
MDVCGGAGRKLALVVIVMSELVLKDHRERSGKVLGVRTTGIGRTIVARFWRTQRGSELAIGLFLKRVEHVVSLAKYRSSYSTSGKAKHDPSNSGETTLSNPHVQSLLKDHCTVDFLILHSLGTDLGAMHYYIYARRK